MIKKEIYPKTKRVPCQGEKIEITEKLDGANLVIFKLNEDIYIAQRNTIYKYDEIDEYKQPLYKGLYQWLKDNYLVLYAELWEGSAICGEWLGMGKLKYNINEFDKRFNMFAKANITENFDLYNIIYNHKLFIYPFKSQVIPNFIGIVPVVTELTNIPNKEQLDNIYQKYCDKVKRDVEGFVVNYNDNITKYVRMKNGKLAEHFDRAGDK